MDSDPGSAARSASDKDLQAGQRVGEYVIEQKIGEGGFGTVFRASHPLIGKLAAIKVLNRQYSADPEMVSRFVAEARAVNQIRHRNIIDIFAFGQIEDGRSYYVMEFLEGEPLDEFLDHCGAVPLGDAIPILRAVARALDAAHAKGIAHRDLKPENIFLARESDGSVFPKLLDFGIAKLLGTAGAGAPMHKTRTGAPIGTPYYMSPEQCRGRDVDHRTDIYAFGVVAYKLLTAVVPFDGEDYMDILLKQIGEEAAPPSTRLPGLPKAVDDAIAWMMKKDPAARPPNLITAMRALEDAAQAAGVQFSADQASGIYSAQRTPSALRPVPNKTPSSPQYNSLAGAATVDAARLSDAVAAAGPALTPASADLAPPEKKSPILLVVALAGAVAVGAVVFFVIRGQQSGSTPAEPAAEPVAKEPAVVTPDAALPDRPEVAIPRLIKITIEGPPPGTEVYGPRGLLGVAPGEIQLDRGDQEVQLTFKADGYQVAIEKVKADQDRTIQVALEKKETVESASGKGKGTGKGTGKGGGKSDGGGRGGKTDGGKTDGGKTDGKGSGSGSGRDTLEDPFGTKN
jgi:serine/threonine-protein kinase